MIEAQVNEENVGKFSLSRIILYLDGHIQELEKVPGDQKIVEPGQTGTNPEEAAEIARKKGMAKGTVGAAETGSEYEQGAAGSNK